jgi:ATP-dependent DNA helicase PIF1
MMINKSQGQSLSHVGIYFPKSVFTHGQLYVAVSKVTSEKGLKMLILDEEGCVCTDTTNVVYRNVFRNV